MAAPVRLHDTAGHAIGAAAVDQRPLPNIRSPRIAALAQVNLVVMGTTVMAGHIMLTARSMAPITVRAISAITSRTTAGPARNIADRAAMPGSTIMDRRTCPVTVLTTAALRSPRIAALAQVNLVVIGTLVLAGHIMLAARTMAPITVRAISAITSRTTTGPARNIADRAVMPGGTIMDRRTCPVTVLTTAGTATRPLHKVSTVVLMDRRLHMARITAARNRPEGLSRLPRSAAHLHTKPALKHGSTG